MQKISSVGTESDFIESEVGSYIELLKPGVMSLVVFTAFVGIIAAPGHIHPVLAIMTVICVAMGSGASGAINMWYDRDIDALMKRTKSRPIPAKKIAPENVLQFGIVLGCLSVMIMGVFVNILSAILLASAILFYVFIYTIWLKRSTCQNIVIGGASGALPPIIGWAAVTNNVSLEPMLMFLIIFLWTPPHFWALALAKSSDYGRANIPMMPLVKGVQYTKRQILYYTIILSLICLVPYFLNIWGKLYFGISTILSAIFIFLAVKIIFSNSKTLYIKTFIYSIIYLFALFGVILFEKLA